jgi:hypothetical protein
VTGFVCKTPQVGNDDVNKYTASKKCKPEIQVRTSSHFQFPSPGSAGRSHIFRKQHSWKKRHSQKSKVMSLNPEYHKNEETAARQEGGDSSSNMPSCCSIEGSCQGIGLANARKLTANALQLQQAPRIPLLQLSGPDTVVSLLREIRRRRTSMAQCDRHRLKALRLPLRTIDEQSQFDIPPLPSSTGRIELHKWVRRSFHKISNSERGIDCRHQLQKSSRATHKFLIVNHKRLYRID